MKLTGKAKEAFRMLKPTIDSVMNEIIKID
jgi:hypothetical protein